MSIGVPTLRTSERKTFRRCPQKWWWGYRMGQVKNGPPALPLWFGIGVHQALAGYYLPGKKRGPHPVKTWKKYCKEEMVWLHARDYDTDEYVNAEDLGIAMLEGYIEKYGSDQEWNVLQPEYTAAVDIPDEKGRVVVRYLFTCDGVVWDEETGTYKIIENKTAAQILTTFLVLDDQAGSYLPMATAKLRHEKLLTGRKKIETIEYNFLRKTEEKIDTRPIDSEGFRLNKDGTRSKNQKLQADRFTRVPVHRSDRERATQIERILAEVKVMQMMVDGRLPVYKNTTPGCGGGQGESKCEFFDVCQIHEQKGDWETLMKATFHTEDPYFNYRKVA